MEILYIATSFPKPEEGATIYTDLAEALYEAGHKITVAVSNQKKTESTRINKERGFEVLRIVTGNYYDVSLIEKGITTLSIPYLMRIGISKYLGSRKFDFILFEAPPVTNGSLIKWAKKKFNCPSYLMLKDIFPQNAVDIGIIKKDSFIYKFFLYKEKRLYKSADMIGCMSVGNRDYILKHNPSIDKDKIEIFPNTKKITKKNFKKEESIRLKYSIPQEACLFLFGGNMGKPQFIDLLCKTVVECKIYPDIYFLFVGRGTERVKLENTIKSNNIKNAKVISNLPREEYEQITKESDVGLIVLDPRFTIPNFPSRILSYMEYSKPILAATDKVTDLKDVIEQSECGVWVPSSDGEKFIEAVKMMSVNPNLQKMGSNGRKFVETHYRLEYSVEILEKHFN